MLEVTRDTNVYTAHDEHVGSVDRMVLDPVTRRMSHIVVRKGLFFQEDKLIRMEDISTATPERINLRQDVGEDDFLPFVEQYFVPLDEADRTLGLVDRGSGSVSMWHGPLGVPAPMDGAMTRAVSKRNIPDRLTALEAGVPVFASNHEIVGRLERVVTTNAGLPTHFVIEADGLAPERRAVPIAWVQDITEDAVTLGTNMRTIEAIVPLGPDE